MRTGARIDNGENNARGAVALKMKKQSKQQLILAHKLNCSRALMLRCSLKSSLRDSYFAILRRETPGGRLPSTLQMQPGLNVQAITKRNKLMTHVYSDAESAIEAMYNELRG